MPELPEVETVRRGLAPVMEGRKFTRVTLNRDSLRFSFPERFRQRLEGARIKTLHRRAKYILADLDTGETLLIHLGMTGRFKIENQKAPGDFHHKAGHLATHDHVIFALDDGTIITYNDARRFGFMDLAGTDTLDQSPFLKHLGIEPLGDALSGQVLLDLFRGRKTPFKAALLDQRLIAGLGNIYVCEALFRAQLNPESPAGSLEASKADDLARHIRSVLEEALQAGGSTLRDFVHTDGELGYFQHRFQVYGREGEPCPLCQTLIQRLVQSGRSTFFCQQCQNSEKPS